MIRSISMLGHFWRDESGASAAEYALLLAIVATTLSIGALDLGGAISTALTNTSNCLDAGLSC